MYDMVGGFEIVHDPKDIAFYAGLLLTSYHFIRTVTIMYWGILSDRIGRRPVLLLGLLGDLLTFALFGVSKSFTWAIVVRCLNGLFTGSAVVIKPVAAEISDSTNRPRMMAMLQMMWHLGSMLGGAIGGVLADPVKNYPWLFGNSVLFREYPYLLPCLAGSAISMFGLVVGFFQLEETLEVQPTRALGSGATSETTLLISEAQSEEGRVQANVKPDEFSKWDILTPTVIRVLVTNTILCFAVGMHNQIYPIFAATDVAVGGLGMDARTIGYTLVLCSFLVVTLQLAVYPGYERKHGALVCYRQGLLWLAVFGITMPLLSNYARYMGYPVDSLIGAGMPNLPSLNACVFWGFIFIEMFIRMYGDILAYTSVNTIAINVAPRKNYLGFITGLQQQGNSITFMLGPLISGYLWSWSIKHSFPYPFNSHFAWVVSGVSLIVAWYITRKIPESVNIFASGPASDRHGRATSNDNESTNDSTEDSH
ncbi:hypothetical protein EV175_006230 [Coemansia sp. RSA 1933]|nr:hypothetical protein EV175_006230 [Coemansia sp. RSA 1933]